MNVRNYSESPPWMPSPTNSDNNYYGSPAISPGSWNVASPDMPSPGQASWNASSPESHSSSGSSSYWGRVPPNNTPSTVSSSGSSRSVSSSGSSKARDFIRLPLNLGKPDAIPKTKHDVKREKRSELKAQELLINAWANSENSDPESGRTPASPRTHYPQIDDNGYAARQKAIQEYKEKKRLAKINALTNGGSPRPLSMPPPIILRSQSEKLATSTRQKKVVPPEEDYESINDYKTVIDIEREQEARRTALYLLKKYGF